MAAEIDSLTIKDLEARYGVVRSNIYNRINGLKKKGYVMEPEKRQGQSIYNADQIRAMDALDAHLKAGGDIADFPCLKQIGQTGLSYRTQDIFKSDNGSMVDGMVLAIAEKVVDILTLRQPLSPSPLTDPLANLRAIQEVCDRGWELRTSQLAPLLGLKSLHGTEIKRHGFVFTKVGKIGAESAWKVMQAGEQR